MLFDVSESKTIVELTPDQIEFLHGSLDYSAMRFRDYD
jgi:hypothetical protein